MQQLVASGVTPVDSLTVVENEELPRHFAVIGEGTDPDGNSLLVGYSPTSGGDAALAVIAILLALTDRIGKQQWALGGYRALLIVSAMPRSIW